MILVRSNGLEKVMIKLPKRYNNDVGKFIGGNVYVHRDYEDTLPTIKAVKALLKKQPYNWGYEVVKYNLSNGNMSFIQCPGFNDEDEPDVGNVLLVTKTGIRTIRQPADPYIYHHKFLFVRESYKGFDVEASVKRSLVWMSLSGVDYSRIGKKSYWEREVAWRIK